MSGIAPSAAMRCGYRLLHRALATMKLTLLCAECALPQMDADTELVVSPETMDELRQYRRELNVTREAVTNGPRVVVTRAAGPPSRQIGRRML